MKNISLSGVPEDMESAIALANKKDDRTRKEIEKWAVLSYSDNRAIINEKKGGDGGIDGIAFMKDYDGKDAITKEVLFSFKSDKKLNPTVIRDLNGTIEREGAVMGYLLTLYEHPNMEKESKKYGTYKNQFLEKNFPKIQVISVKDILNGKRMDIPLMSEMVKSAQLKKEQGPELPFA